MKRRYVAVAAAILATVTGVAALGGGGGSQTANIWVDTSATGNTCVDNATEQPYSTNNACSSLDAANDTCENGDTVRIMGGTYGAQTVTGGNGRTAMCNMRIADGQTATVDGINFHGASWAHLHGGGARFGVGARIITAFSERADLPQNQEPINVGGGSNNGAVPGSHHITVEGSDFGGWNTSTSQFVTWRNNDIGPCDNVDNENGTTYSNCDNGSIEYCEVGVSLGGDEACTGYNEDHLVEGNLLHDFNCDDSFYNGVGGNDCHWECMYVSYPRRLIVRGNIFYNCANGGDLFNTYSNGGGPQNGGFEADFPYTDYTIENNVFTGACSNTGSSCGGYLEVGSGIGHCNINGIGSAAVDLDGVTIRFNTFIGPSMFDLRAPSSFPQEGDPAREGCYITASDKVKVYGNITKMASDASCGGEWDTRQGGATPSQRYNVFYAGSGGTCSGTGNVNVGSSLTGVVTNPVNGANVDAHLAGAVGSTTADNLVPVSEGCPATDFDGQARATSGFCDAGADER